MSKKKDLVERIALLEAEKAERENPEKAVVDEPKAEDAKVEPEKADEPKVEDAKAEDAKVEPEKADEPKAEDAKADKSEGTTAVVAGAGKHCKTAPEPVDDELDALSSEELEQMAKQMQEQAERAKAKLEAAKAKISMMRKKADEKAAAEAKAKAEAEAAEAAKAEAEAEAEAKAKAEAEAKAKAEAEAAKAARTFSDAGHPDRAYRYWSIKDRTWLITSDFWVAKQFGGDTWQPLWAWYIDGKIDHILSQEEADKYLP